MKKTWQDSLSYDLVTGERCCEIWRWRDSSLPLTAASAFLAEPAVVRSSIAASDLWPAAPPQLSMRLVPSLALAAAASVRGWRAS